ncbi:GAF and ANTAR domain-containing protein [Serinicoccus sp. LYQ131]|uniref:GAF and ANTAR domain-containing protein n=1 Tax=Serinicoccus sp. LYQ131 TaxID=3378797 RepID=UPI003851D6A4
MSTIPADRLAAAFVEIADTLVDEFDLIEFLQMVTTRTTELTSVAAAGLLLADPQGNLAFMAASDESVKLLELFQVQKVEGPCQDCFRQRAPVVNADLRHARDSWPAFAPRAVAAGYRSVHAIPLRHRSEVIGALNLFGTDVGHLAPSDVRIVQALADIATIGLLQERSIRRSHVLSEQLQGALNSRIIVEQAKGALAQLRGVSVDEAFLMLRAYCRRTGQRLGEVASEVIVDTSSHPDLTRAP